jgi:hypothetical protein
VWGWEQVFRIDWTVVDRGGRPVLSGEVISRTPNTLTGIRLLVESFDAAGGVVAQRVQWLPGDLAPFSRAAFQAPVPAPAAHYRVRVFVFERIEVQGWE